MPEVAETNSKPQIERYGNVARIHKPAGDYSIIYGVHIKTQNPKDIPDDSSGLVLETNAPWIDNPEGYLKSFRTNVQYGDVIKKSEVLRMPIIFADIPYNIPGIDDQLLNSLLVAAAEIVPMAAVTTIGVRLMQNLKDIELSRRGFLKAGLGLTGIYGVSPFVSQLARMFSSLSGIGEEQTAEVRKVTSRIHPQLELLLLTIRNTVLAHKEEELVKSQLLGNRPNLATIIGADHVGIEDKLLASREDRIKFLKATKPLWGKLVRPDIFSSSVVLDYNGKEWNVRKIVEHEDLKQLTADESK